MSRLELAIQEAARSGRLSGLSIVIDPSGRGWQANAPSPHGSAWSVHIHPDPVTALTVALGGMAASAGIEPSAPMLDVSAGKGVFD